MAEKITIAIDGHSSTGKSTAAKELAKTLGYIYVDTGAMYRAVALFALNNGMVSEGSLITDRLLQDLDQIQLEFKTGSRSVADIYLNDKNVEDEIRSLEVANIVSPVAAVPEVRRKLVALQQAMGKAGGVVMDGRDIGTVVFPDAELKIFMTAGADVRAQRRYEELKTAGREITYQDVYDNVVARDYIDSNREDSPLRQADDAILLDTSAMDREKQSARLLKLAEKALAKK